jgi:hypothetical protein
LPRIAQAILESGRECDEFGREEKALEDGVEQKVAHRLTQWGVNVRCESVEDLCPRTDLEIEFGLDDLVLSCYESVKKL